MPDRTAAIWTTTSLRHTMAYGSTECVRLMCAHCVRNAEEQPNYGQCLRLPFLLAQGPGVCPATLLCAEERRPRSVGRSEGVPPTAEWLQEVYRAIEACDTFVFVLSPDSVASVVCAMEAAHALSTHKRIVPLVCRDVNASDVDVQEPVKPIAALNWIFFRPLLMTTISRSSNYSSSLTQTWPTGIWPRAF